MAATRASEENVCLSLTAADGLMYVELHSHQPQIMSRLMKFKASLGDTKGTDKAVNLSLMELR